MWILGVACATLLACAAAHADWPVSGRALCTDAANQFFPVIASDGSGGGIVVWGDDRQAGLWLYAQRVLYNGLISSGWPTDGVRVGASSSYLTPGQIASDGVGGAYFTWGGDDEFSTSRVVLQRITPAAGIATGWPADGLVLSTATYQASIPRLANDGEGGVLVCWNDLSSLRIQRVRADGTLYPGWPVGGALVTDVAGSSGIPSVVGDGNGGAIVAWTDLGSGSGDVRALRIGSDGLPESGWPSDGVVVCAEDGAQNVTQSLADGVGGAWIVWGDDRNAGTNGRDIYAQHITGSGTPATGWPIGGLAVCDAGGNQSLPRITSDGADGAYFVWSDRRTAPDGDPFLGHLNSDGTLASGWPANGVAVCTAPGTEQLTLGSIVGDGAGGAVVVWSDARDSVVTARDAYAQRFDATGAVHIGWADNGVALCTEAGDQTFVSGVADGNGGAIMTWDDGRSGDLFDHDIYAIGVRMDGTTPVQVALVNVDADGNRVRLDWYAPEGLPAGASIERRTNQSPWTAIAPAEQDGLGHVRHEDREIIRGMRYAYRLGLAGGPLTAETWVDVPVSNLSVIAAAADPGGVVRVQFSLQSSGRASLQLFDVAGRCVRADSPIGLGPGVHEVRFPSSLPSGLYWLRLTQDGVAVHRRVLVSL